MFENIGQWVMDTIGTLGHLGLFLLLVLENLFPPIPSEIVLPVAGFLVGRGELNFVGALAAATFGSVAGALLLYAMGRWGGRGLVLRYGKWLRVGPEELDRAEGWFARYRDAVVLVARVVPFARSVVSIPAGTAKMGLVRFTALTAAGAAVWNAVLIWAGYFLGANWGRVSGWIGTYSDTVLIVGTGAAAAYLLLRHLRKRKDEG